MKITTIGNLIETEVFKSKDGKNTYHNLKVLVDDTMCYFKFVNKQIYDSVKDIQRLGNIDVDIDVVSCGFDANNNPIYNIRLLNAKPFVFDKKG